MLVTQLPLMPVSQLPRMLVSQLTGMLVSPLPRMLVSQLTWMVVSLTKIMKKKPLMNNSYNLATVLKSCNSFTHCRYEK